MANDRPIHEIRLGKCKAAIWPIRRNRGRVTTLPCSGFTSRTTSSFGRDDLPLVAKLAEQAHTWPSVPKITIHLL